MRRGHAAARGRVLLCSGLASRAPPTTAADPVHPPTQSASRHMLKACNLRTSARLALSYSDAQAGKALVFEAPADAQAPQGRAAANDSSRLSLPLPPDPGAGVLASRMDLHNTLLASAIQTQQARFISDIGKYMSVSGRSGDLAIWAGSGTQERVPP